MMKNSAYYGSDLNKLIDEKCTRLMTCINVDCLLIKVSYKRIRFIESKHTHERMNKGQLTALRILMIVKHPTYRIESFIVRGEYPFYTAVVEIPGAHVYSVPTRKWTLDQKSLIKWLDFEQELGVPDEPDPIKVRGLE